MFPPQPPPSGYPTFPMPIVNNQSVKVTVGGGCGGGHRRPRRVHPVHGWLTLLSCGAWAPVWAWKLWRSRR